MIAIDTNVLVRVLTNDDRAQARRAMARMRSDSVWIARTVLLETEWVLRYSYDLDGPTIRAAFNKVLGVPTIGVEDRDAVLLALSWYGDGMDFADALHLSVSGGAMVFVSFDRGLEKASKRVGAKPDVVMP